MCVCVCVSGMEPDRTLTFLDGRESEQLDQTKVVPSDDHLMVEGCVGGIDVVELGILGPNPVDLCTQYPRP